METKTLSIEFNNAGKKFFRNWIFKNLNLQIKPQNKISVLGPNGSGKSTFLQVLSGYESLSTGSIIYQKNGKDIPRENIFSHVSIAAPYLEMIEEFTLEEAVHFHFKFKGASHDLKHLDIIQLMELKNPGNKVIKYYSSGMKQRTKLALAILSEVDLVLLDEPLSNLDKAGEQWYRNLAEKYLKDKTVIVCSNQNESEYFFCEKTVRITDYQ